MAAVIFGILMTLVIICVKDRNQDWKGGMRVSKEKAAQNRERILTSAARLFREHGISATGVDSITDDAGLTHGGLYSQFRIEGGDLRPRRFASRWREASASGSERSSVTPAKRALSGDRGWVSVARSSRRTR